MYRMASPLPFALCPLTFPRRQHALQRDDAIAALHEVLHGAPIDRTISPYTDPQPAAVGRGEESFSLQQPLDLVRLQPEGHRGSALHTLEGHKGLLARLEIRVPPRR